MAIYADFGLFGSVSGTAGVNGNTVTGNSFSRISITADSGGLKVNTPYNADFVYELKGRIPATARKWDASQKAWYVSRDYADKLKELVDRIYKCDVQLPTVIAEPAQVFEHTFQADYVAACRNGAASVWANGGWNAKAPEKVLRAWFKQAETTGPATLYGLLGCDETARPEEIKKAYKRAARTWHPDICKEENAREMFEQIKEAFDVLSDPLSRNKYNAGLMFERMAKQGNRDRRGRTVFPSSASFTPVLRCGMLTVKAKRELGILVIEEILAWEDITNEFGQIMVSFWAGDSFSVMWV